MRAVEEYDEEIDEPRIDRVRHIDYMNNKFFCMHMTKRHHESLGGLSHLWVASPKVLDAWRAFHEQLHRVRHDLLHEHEQ
jgi:hypothetical protein